MFPTVLLQFSGVWAVGAGGARGPQKFGKNLKKIRHWSFEFFNIIDEIILFLLSLQISVYCVIENTLNIYKIK